MREPQTLRRRYSIYILLFYCLAITLYCRSSLLSFNRSCFSPNTQSFRPTANTTVPHSSDNTPSPSGPTTFPHLLWQTSRTSLPTLSHEIQSNIKSWLDLNPSYIHNLITAPSGLTYARDHYAPNQTILSTFLALNDPMLRADLVQYLFLYHHGGVYTDLDTICLSPIDTWIPHQFSNSTINLVLGIEGDALGGDIIPGFTYPVQFATWTMAVQPRHFIIRKIIDRVVSQIIDLAIRQNTTIENIEASYMDVMDTTGPGVFTESVYAGLSEIEGGKVDSANLTGMKEPRLFRDVLVLPVTGFGAGLPHSEAGSVDDDGAFVQHLFAGSWKNAHPFTESSSGSPEEATSDETAEKTTEGAANRWQEEAIEELPELQEADINDADLRGHIEGKGHRRKRRVEISVQT